MLLAVTGVAFVGACASPQADSRPGGSSGKPFRTGESNPIRDRALASEADLLKQYDAALSLPSVKADSALSAKLIAIRAEHASHAGAIGAGYKPSSPPPPTTPAPTPTPTPASTTDADIKATVTALAEAEQNAANARTADILSTDGATAMLLASVAASEAGHAALLLKGAV